MKNLLLIIVSVIFFSCQESERAEPEKKTRLLTFSVSGLTYTIDGIASTKNSGQKVASTTESLEGKIKQLAFVVYDHTGVEVKRKMQYSTEDYFGTWQVELPVAEPEYKVVVIGSKQTFNINSYKNPLASPPVLQNYSSARMMYYQPILDLVDELQYKTEDTFYAEYNFFNRAPDADDVYIELQRIVGKLEININDSDNYSVRILNEATEFSFSAKRSENKIDDDMGHNYVTYNGTPITFFILRTDQPLLIEFYYPVGTIGGWREVSVPVYKNKRTVVSGNLYQASRGLSVTVNDEWEADAPPVTF